MDMGKVYEIIIVAIYIVKLIFINFYRAALYKVI